jgi:hypothetical protein
MKKIVLSLFAAALIFACESQMKEEIVIPQKQEQRVGVKIFIEDSIGSNLLIDSIYPHPINNYIFYHHSYDLLYENTIQLVDTLKNGYKHELTMPDSREHIFLNLTMQDSSFLTTESIIAFLEENKDVFLPTYSYDTIRCEINGMRCNKIWVNQRIAWVWERNDTIPILHIIKPFPIWWIGGLPNPGDPGWISPPGEGN